MRQCTNNVGIHVVTGYSVCLLFTKHAFLNCILRTLFRLSSKLNKQKCIHGQPSQNLINGHSDLFDKCKQKYVPE